MLSIKYILPFFTLNLFGMKSSRPQTGNIYKKTAEKNRYSQTADDYKSLLQSNENSRKNSKNAPYTPEFLSFPYNSDYERDDPLQSHLTILNKGVVNQLILEEQKPETANIYEGVATPPPAPVQATSPNNQQSLLSVLDLAPIQNSRTQAFFQYNN